MLLLIPVAVDYVDYLNKPGSDTISVRTVEWIRDNGGNGIVNTIERWWYTNNPPPTGGRPDAIKTQKTVVDDGANPSNTTATTLPQIQHLAAADRAGAHARDRRAGERRRVAADRVGWWAASPPSTRRSCDPTRCTPRTSRA